MPQALVYALALLATTIVTHPMYAQTTGGTSVPVTADNFIRAETDLYFGNAVKDGGFGKFHHNRELMPIDRQTAIRSNRDTLYSVGVFDLDAGVVTVFLPDAKGRFMSLQVITQDHYAPDVVYEPGRYSFSREKYVTRYILIGIRTLVDPNKPGDLDEVHALQDAIQVVQHGTGPGSFEVPNWDPVSQKKVRDALIVLGSTVADSTGMFGRSDEVSPVRHLIGSAIAWGGNPEKEAKYLNVTPEKNDGETIHRLAVGEVPIDGFWSISVYNGDGYFQKNDQDAYTINNITSEQSADGSVTVQFGGCDGKTPNCLPIMPGWNYIVRLYRPRKEILNGTWKFPDAQPVDATGDNAMLSGEWVLVQLNGGPVVGRDITLEFDTEAGRAAGSTGVNRWGGGFKQSRQSLAFGPLMSTRRAGPTEAMRLKHEFTQALDKVTQFTQDADRLVLSAGDKPLLLFERAQP